MKGRAQPRGQVPLRPGALLYTEDVPQPSITVPPLTRTPQTRRETLAILWALGAFLLATPIAMAWGWGSRAPLAGDDSVGSRAAIIAAVAGGASFAAAWLDTRTDDHLSWRTRLPGAKRILDLVSLTLAVAMISALAVEAMAGLFQRGFVGLTIDPVAGGLLTGGAAAAIAYTSANIGSHITVRTLSGLAALVLFLGTMASMLTTNDENWWELHFSQLGNVGGAGGLIFNGGLICAGLTITVLGNFAGREVEKGLEAIRWYLKPAATARNVPVDHLISFRVSVVTWLLILIGVFMMVVGFVHDAVNSFVHVGAATGMTIAFAVLAVFTLIKLPGLPFGYFALSIGVMAGIIAAIPLWIPIGYYNLTAVEMIAAGLLFSWLVVFGRTVTIYGQRGEHPA